MTSRKIIVHDIHIEVKFVYLLILNSDSEIVGSKIGSIHIICRQRILKLKCQRVSKPRNFKC